MAATSSRKQALLDKARTNPESITFQELQALATAYGFAFDRERGSHRQYVRLEEPVGFANFQPRKGDKKMAKPYQVRQLVSFIDDLPEEEEED